VVPVFFGCTSHNRLEGHIYYRINANPTTLDPARIVDVTVGTISAKIFNCLGKIGDSLSIQPDLAEHWTVSPDALRYAFHIRKSVLFSNNQEVNDYDVKYSFKRYLTSVQGLRIPGCLRKFGVLMTLCTERLMIWKG